MKIRLLRQPDWVPSPSASLTFLFDFVSRNLCLAYSLRRRILDYKQLILELLNSPFSQNTKMVPTLGKRTRQNAGGYSTNRSHRARAKSGDAPQGDNRQMTGLGSQIGI